MADIVNSIKDYIYKTFEVSFCFEKNLSILPSKLQILLKFQKSNHRIPVETGRWLGIPLNERLIMIKYPM